MRTTTTRTTIRNHSTPPDSLSWNARARVRLGGGVFFLALLASVGSSSAGAEDCDHLPIGQKIESATIQSAKMVSADHEKNLPAFCEIKALIEPVASSHIGVVFRLPENWNGKFLGVGGGGFAGNVTLAAAAAGLSKGYAVAGTDAGHPSPSVTDGSFMIDRPGHVDPVQLADFGYRSIHLMTTVGKQLVQTYYGRQSSRAYFEGCSTGGRQGFTEVQRFPEDYDGVISGAPVYDLRVQTSGVFRLQAFHQQPASLITPQQLKAVHEAVLNACDASDGVRDGIIADPLACKWDPSELACKAGETGAACLSPEQVVAVRRSYDGVKSSNGEVAAWPLMRGGELAWQARSLGTADDPLGQNYSLSIRYLMTLVYGDADHPWKTATADEIVRDKDASSVVTQFQANNPDVSAFVKRGGKFLIWHGLQDPGPSPLGTLEYFQAARAATAKAMQKGEQDIDGNMRFFLAPGVFHCRGGPGPDQFDMLGSIDDWVEKGRAPDRIIATKAGSTLSRPLCPFPQTAHYVGSGDVNQATNFVCR